MLVMKNMTNNTMYIVQELHAFGLNGIASNEIAFNEVVFNRIAFKVSLLSISFTSIILLHSLTNLSTILLIQFQFL